MKDEIILFETAKLAKEKGFNAKCLSYWGINYVMELTPELNSSFNRHTYNYNGDEFIDQSYSAPSQGLLQRWLREKHYIHIEILLSDDSPYEQFYIRYMKIGQYFSLAHDDVYKDTYEEALEIGLNKALKLIINK